MLSNIFIIFICKFLHVTKIDFLLIPNIFQKYANDCNKAVFQGRKDLKKEINGKIRTVIQKNTTRQGNRQT